MDDLISRKAAIEAFEPEHRCDWYTPWIIEKLEELPSVEPFTNEEKAMFIEFMNLMMDVCEKLDVNYNLIQCLSYTRVCKSIDRKVRDVFWNSSV